MLDGESGRPDIPELRWRLTRLALSGAPAHAITTLTVLLHELRDAVGADHSCIGICARFEQPPTKRGTLAAVDAWHPVELLAEDWSPHMMAAHDRCSANPDYGDDPVMIEFMQGAGQDRVQNTRERLAAYGGAGPGAALLDRFGISHRLVGGTPISHDREVFFCLDRAVGGHPFLEVDAALMMAALPVMRPIAAMVCRLLGWLDADAPLTPREREVLSLLLLGLSEQECAMRLDMAASSIHQVVVRIYRKMRVTTRAELMAKWLDAPPPRPARARRVNAFTTTDP